MIRIKTIATLVLFLFLCIPGRVSIAQQTVDEEIHSLETSVKDKKTDKKKVKDIIEIDDTFYINLAINVVAVLIIITLIYYPNNRKKDYIFTYFIFNIIIFLLTYVLNEVKISMGAAFGLFAVFSMLRYRTDGISMKDMTYLFIFIATGLLNAIRLELQETGIINVIIVASTFILDGNVFIKRELTKNVQYDNIELIKPEQHEALMEDLKKRTGLNIHRIAINKLDFLKDTANIRIYYYE